uniref:Adenosylcobinamide-GDP ribazoletransferase n=1 Tax=mine drainage metagenome TaxID=410659 RepID=E6Q873_9ZZZZ
MIPFGRASESAPPDSYAIVMLPLVGACIGAASGAAGSLASRWVAEPWPALVAFSAMVLLTGAIHIDGFLDCCDGVLASVPPRRRLEILKDSRHGTYAVVGMVLLALWWVAALERLAPASLVLVLAFTGALARLSAVPLMRFFGYAYADSVSRRLDSAEEIGAFALLTVGTALLAAMLSPWVPLLLPAAGAAAIGIAWVCSRRLDGVVTGDVYGAAIVLVELALLIAIGLLPWR